MKLCYKIHFVLAMIAMAFVYPAEAMEHGKMNHSQMSGTTKIMICHVANEDAHDEASADGIRKIFYSTQKMGFHQCPHQRIVGSKMGMNCMCGGMRSCDPLQDKSGSSIASGGAHGEIALLSAINVFGDSSSAKISSQIFSSLFFAPEPEPPRFL